MSVGNQGRPTDETRVLRLIDAAGGMSNARLRAELELTDTRYQKVKRSLLEKGYVEPYRCRSGGLMLTKDGQNALSGTATETIQSNVNREKELYGPLKEYLERAAEEDELTSLVIDTSNLRNRGKWQNPDLTQITIEHYNNLRKTSIILTTYEVKKWGGWDVGVVFEAASHRRFSHHAQVVLEWPKDANFSLTDPTYRVDEIARECQRFGVGLMPMRKYYSSYRLHSHIEPEEHVPSFDAIENWLEYVLSKNETVRKSYENLLDDLQ